VPTEGLIIQKVAKGTSNLAKGAAMTREQAAKAIQVGFDVACDLVLDGHDILIAGDMGIGNTTPSAAIVAFMVGAPVASVTGYGTGISSELFEKKVAIIESAVSRTASSIDRIDVLGVLSSIGGFEHGATVGFIIGAAFSKVPLVLDGVISNSSALLARELSPLSLQYCFAGHASREVGAKVANSALGMEPLLNLDLALGEGSGALLALGLIQGATDLLADMATFDQAGVTEK
jgi:nicotinate-nucleotide--dimethylbenzimidazole phosphoribosyltransferase